MVGFVSSEDEPTLLSCNPRWWSRHALLASEPQAPRQATACPRWKADHDSADRRAPRTDGCAEPVLDHYERRPASRHPSSASEASCEANHRRACRTQYSARHWFGGISLASPRSRGGAWSV